MSAAERLATPGNASSGLAYSEQARRDLAPFASKRWRLRLGVQDLTLAFRAGNDLPEADVVEISGHIGTSPFRLAMPGDLVDALLSRAPESYSLAQLVPDDAALLMEHLVSAALDAAEQAMRMPIRLDRIEKAFEPLPHHAIPLAIDVADRRFAAALIVHDPSISTKLAIEIERIATEGPGAVAGMPVSIGPIRVHEDDIATLTPGDQLLLDGASVERLQGGVMLDEANYWPIEIVDGAIRVAGALLTLPPLTRDRMVPVFLHVGLTGDASPMKTGDRVPMQRLDPRGMVLASPTAVLGKGALVNLPEGIAIRVTEIGGQK